jgi:hypothetical protein
MMLSRPTMKRDMQVIDQIDAAIVVFINKQQVIRV